MWIDCRERLFRNIHSIETLNRMPSPFWIPTDTPGRLAIIARPRGGDWLPDEVAAWKRMGIHTVASLLTPDEEFGLELSEESGECSRAGLAYLAYAVEDRGLPSDEFVFAETSSVLAAEIAKGRSVGIHCRQGIGRSGLLAIGILVSLGVSIPDAIRRVSAARGRPVPETPEQLEWISRFNVPALAAVGSK